MAKKIRISIAQCNLHVGDIEGNAEQVLSATAFARVEQSADLVIFPELSLSGYPPEDLVLRDGFCAAVAQSLDLLVKQIKGIKVVVGYPLLKDGLLYNAASVLADGKILCTYHKQQIPNYGVFDEKRYFTPGDEACVFAVNGVSLALTICEDIWRPGAVNQALRAGADLIININASPYHEDKQSERETVLIQRVRESGLPVVYCNLVGGQDELVFDGASMVIAADESIHYCAPMFASANSLVEFANVGSAGDLQPSVAQTYVLPQREQSNYQAIVLAVRDYVGKNGFPGIVMGLSGGIDSALTLAVAVDALGAENVQAVMMPYQYTSDMSIEDARAEAQALGVRYDEIAIESMFDAFVAQLNQKEDMAPSDLAKQNLQARCRGVLLMAISNETGRMVLTTGNKSEMAVGYATLYGDMAGGFAPLKDVSKTMVYQLARYRNTISDVIPERVINRAPSAELAPDQKDVDSLPAYEILDPILVAYVEEDKSVAEIIADGFSEETVRKVVGMVRRNEYKRRQAPPGVKLTARAFGRDRRYPITSRYV